MGMGQVACLVVGVAGVAHGLVLPTAPSPSLRWGVAHFYRGKRPACMARRGRGVAPPRPHRQTSKCGAAGLWASAPLATAAEFDEWVVDAWRGHDGYARDRAKAEEEARLRDEGETEAAWLERQRREWLNNEGALVYGEVSVHGFRGVARRMQLGAEDSFYDLGSGVGKSVAQAWLEFGVRESRGVELAAERHAAAVAAVAEILKRATGGTAGGNAGVFCGGRVELTCGDILDADLSQTTAVWCANVCFAPDFDARIARKLAQQPRLRAIAVIKDFAEGVEGFEYGGAEEFDMSWSQECRAQGLSGGGGLVHFYFR